MKYGTDNTEWKLKTMLFSEDTVLMAENERQSEEFVRIMSAHQPIFQIEKGRLKKKQTIADHYTMSQ